uniref:Uncharacterized protein n=1 Tax=Rhizophora mucronata TaxID=61149 RepID=A0A2P2N5Y7_RHIMU
MTSFACYCNPPVTLFYKKLISSLHAGECIQTKK